MHTVGLPAGTIEYTDSGSGAPVVLLHGPLMNHRVWDPVLELLPDGFRYLRPDLPLGSHRIGMKPDAELDMAGLNRLIADFLAALDLTGVTLVHADWGGGLFLTSYALDQRVSRLVVCPCEAFDNFPPGLPGKALVLAARMPGGLTTSLRLMRLGWVRNLPFTMGAMAARPLPDELVQDWSEPALGDPSIRRDLRKYGSSRFDPGELVARTEALAGFTGDALVLWSDNRVMPLEHGRRLAALLPRAEFAVVDDAAVLTMLDQPAVVADRIARFLVAAPAR